MFILLHKAVGSAEEFELFIEYFLFFSVLELPVAKVKVGHDQTHFAQRCDQHLPLRFVLLGRCVALADRSFLRVFFNSVGFHTFLQLLARLFGFLQLSFHGSQHHALLTAPPEALNRQPSNGQDKTD